MDINNQWTERCLCGQQVSCDGFREQHCTECGQVICEQCNVHEINMGLYSLVPCAICFETLKAAGIAALNNSVSKIALYYACCDQEVGK